MGLEGIILTEIKQRKTYSVYLFYVESKKLQLLNATKQKLANPYRK